MRKNMNLSPSPSPLLNKHKEIRLWPSCKHPKTLSFRATTPDHDSLFIDPKEFLPEAEVELTMPGYYFSNSSESATASMSTESETYFDYNESSSVEIIVRGVKSERLFFKPDTTSAILETQGSGRQRTTPVDIDGGVFPYKESVAMVMESEDPYGDFKRSMEEMMESLDLKDWDCLEELLGWYLRMNGKNNHEFIIGAFVDLLVGISGGDDSCSDHSIASFNSAASTFSSPISSPLYQVGSEKNIDQGKMIWIWEMFHKIALEFTELNKKVIPRILQWKRVIDITWESCMSFIHGYEDVYKHLWLRLTPNNVEHSTIWLIESSPFSNGVQDKQAKRTPKKMARTGVPSSSSMHKQITPIPFAATIMGTYEERLTTIEATIQGLQTCQNMIANDMVQIKKEMSNSFTQIRQELTLMRATVPCVMDNYENMFVDADEFIDKMEGDEKKHVEEEAKSTDHTVVPNKEDEKESYIKVAMFKDVDKKVVGIHDGSNDECGNNKDDKVVIFEDVEKKKDRSIVDKGPMYKIPKNVDLNKHKKRPRAYFKSSYMSIPSTSREPLRPPHFKIDALQSEEIFALYDKRDEEALSFTYRGEYVGYPWGIDFWKHIFCHNDPIEERGWLETSHIDMWSLLLLDTKLPDERWTIMPIHFMAFFDEKSLIPFANGSKPPYEDWANVDLVLFPININNCHWLTGGMDLRTWNLTLYDSSISEVSNEIILENLLAFKENFNDFLKLIDYWTKTGRESTHMNLNIQFAKGVPQQVNGSDCGVFVCMWLEALSSGKELNIKKDDVAAECMEYRRRMARIIWARRD